MSRTPRHFRTQKLPYFAIALTTLVTAACGATSDSDGAPPRTRDASSDEAIALESGTYFIDRVWDIQDACGSEPLYPQRPITAVPLTLSNDGAGRISLDRCFYDGRQLTGDVVDNRGTLSVRHSKREVPNGEYVAQFDQECRLELTVTDVNTIEGVFTEYQRNRNEIMRLATTDVPSCTTSYKIVMVKR